MVPWSGMLASEQAKDGSFEPRTARSCMRGVAHRLCARGDDCVGVVDMVAATQMREARMHKWWPQGHCVGGALERVDLLKLC